MFGCLFELVVLFAGTCDLLFDFVLGFGDVVVGVLVCSFGFRLGFVFGLSVSLFLHCWCVLVVSVVGCLVFVVELVLLFGFGLLLLFLCLFSLLLFCFWFRLFGYLICAC